MNPNGRPKKKERERRTALSILVRFNEAEARQIKRAHGESTAAKWARERLLEVAP